MKTTNTAIFLVLSIFAFTDCSREKGNTGAGVADTSFLSDKNFVYRNIKGTDEIKEVSRRLKDGTFDDKLYTDSTYKTAYVDLTLEQRVRLIAPFLTKQLGINAKYVRDYMSARFVSKQDKIGNLQPIVISIGGDDYGSTTMIILDKHNKPISGFNLDGGMESGPTEVGDSMMSYEVKSYSEIRGRQITTYRIHNTEFNDNDSLKRPIIVDSSVYLSIIDHRGRIKTRQTVQKRYTEAYQPEKKKS